MRNTKIIIIILCLSIQFIACKEDECQDITFPDQYLDQISSTYQTWKGIQSFIFIDSLGADHKYTLTTDIEFLLDSRKTGFCEDTTRLILFQTEYYLKRYTSGNKTAIAYAQFVDFIEQEETLTQSNLVDKLGISVFNDSLPSPDPISRIILMTSSKNSHYNTIASNAITTKFHESLVIMNKVFYDVYEQNNGDPKLYYDRNNGIISFTDIQGTRLVLDRVE